MPFLQIQIQDEKQQMLNDQSGNALNPKATQKGLWESILRGPGRKMRLAVLNAGHLNQKVWCVPQSHESATHQERKDVQTCNSVKIVR